MSQIYVRNSLNDSFCLLCCFRVFKGERCSLLLSRRKVPLKYVKSLPLKPNRQILTAHDDRSRCISWTARAFIFLLIFFSETGLERESGVLSRIARVHCAFESSLMSWPMCFFFSCSRILPHWFMSQKLGVGWISPNEIYKYQNT